MNDDLIARLRANAALHSKGQATFLAATLQEAAAALEAQRDELEEAIGVNKTVIAQFEGWKREIASATGVTNFGRYPTDSGALRQWIQESITARAERDAARAELAAAYFKEGNRG